MQYDRQGKAHVLRARVSLDHVLVHVALFVASIDF